VRVPNNPGAQTLYIVPFTDTTPVLYGDLTFARYTENTITISATSVPVKGNIKPNTYLQLEFSKPMDGASFRLGDTVILKSLNVNYGGVNTYENLSTALLGPFMSLDHTVVTFYMNPGTDQTYLWTNDRPGWPSSYFYSTGLTPIKHSFQVSGEVRDAKGIPAGKPLLYRFETETNWESATTAPALDLSRPKTIKATDAFMLAVRVSDVEAALAAGRPVAPERTFGPIAPSTNTANVFSPSENKAVYLMMLTEYTCQPVMGIQVYESFKAEGGGVYDIYYGGHSYAPWYRKDDPSLSRWETDERILSALRAVFLQIRPGEEFGKYSMMALKYVPVKNSSVQDGDYIFLQFEDSLVFADISTPGFTHVSPDATTTKTGSGMGVKEKGDLLFSGGADPWAPYPAQPIEILISD
jgi:hypothetical protein